MSKITNLAAIMRSQVAVLAKEFPRQAAQNKDKKTHSNSDTLDVAGLIVQKVKLISRQSPDRRQKAFRIFLENTIAAEIGLDVLSDPLFYQMIEDIQNTMYSDSTLRSLIEECIDQLLASQ
ncbi:hypothetical protein [Undibacterium flavidum]|uniref:Uncharacterized protein n=1 Tax=Undibacterium flavidum TaxID=2762297 RepID=A0ABR6YEQ1_9BURK|nr:hypothetical protein [Undibacterium flavidum]MBC3875049.1 hypothetical protein [Undibacterium flavidum]